MESRTGGRWVRLFCFLTLYPSVLSIIFSQEMNSLVRLKKKGMRTALTTVRATAMLAMPSGRTPHSRAFSSVLKNIL